MRYLIFIFLVLNFSMAIYAKERSKFIKSVNINKAWKVLKLDNPELVEGRQLYFILELKHFAT
jgi:hypothetical protein